MSSNITQEIIDECLRERVGCYNPDPVLRALQKALPRTSYTHVCYTGGLIHYNKCKYNTPPDHIKDFEITWFSWNTWYYTSHKNDILVPVSFELTEYIEPIEEEVDLEKFNRSKK